MASFNTAINIVLDHEGGYQNNPNDTGNYNSRGDLIGTNYGISAPVLESYLSYPPTVNTMRNLSLSIAKDIYRNKFWNRIKGDQINSQPIANIFFDGHVNHGNTGIRMMQDVLGVPRDGVVGPQTLQAINTGNERAIYLNYKATRRQFYQKISQRPGQSVFLTGWLRRIDSFTDFPGVGTPAGSSTNNAPLLVAAGLIAAFWPELSRQFNL